MALPAAAVILAVFADVSLAVLVQPKIPPRGFNSFDLQYDRRANPLIPIWNESYFRKMAPVMARQLLPAGYDTIVIDGGWHQPISPNGFPMPDPERWPSAYGGKGFKPLADWTHSLGLKFGIWTLRGVTPYAVAARLPVLGAEPPVTIDEIAFGQECWDQPAARRWCNCTWDTQGVGLNASHPATATYYNGLVQLYSDWGVDFIKWDCMYESSHIDEDPKPSYGSEEQLAVNAVNAVDREMVLSLSPGGGMTADAAAWVAGKPGGYAPPGTHGGGAKASMYRVTGDFHSRPLSWTSTIPEHVFVIGNLSSTATGPGNGLIGANSTWPDLDIMDLGRDSGFFGKSAAQLHATTWMMARSPLFYGGDLPITDEYTVNLVTNEVALAINAHSSGLQVDYDGDCSCHAWPATSHDCKLFNNPATEPCVATWWSSFGQCTALAVLNIGNKTASQPTEVPIGKVVPKLPARASWTLTSVYEGDTATVHGSVRVSIPGMGGKLMVLSPPGVAAINCI